MTFQRSGIPHIQQDPFAACMLVYIKLTHETCRRIYDIYDVPMRIPETLDALRLWSAYILPPIDHIFSNFAYPAPMMVQRNGCCFSVLFEVEGMATIRMQGNICTQ